MKNSKYLEEKFEIIFYDNKVFKSVDDFDIYLRATYGHTDSAILMICEHLPVISKAVAVEFLNTAKAGNENTNIAKLLYELGEISVNYDPPVQQVMKTSLSLKNTKSKKSSKKKSKK